MPRTTLLLMLPFAFVIVSGCDDGTEVEWPDTGPTDADADVDNDGGADAGCRFDDECEDGIQCTIDRCDRATGLCGHEPDHAYCHDDSQCNGYEFCDALLDCQPGLPYQDCNDHQACTIDICTDPPDGVGLPTCEHFAMDRDGDGHVDYHCFEDPENPDGPRGDDCDDLDPTRFPGAGEFCFDGADNDCDLLIDAEDEDCTLQNDTCDTAIRLMPGVRREGFTMGAVDDYDISCGWGYTDVVYWFILSEEADVTLEFWGNVVTSMNFYPYLSIQTVCGDSSSEVACVSGGQEVRFFERGMAPGTYYVVAESFFEGVFHALLTISTPTPPPEGDSCTDPIAIADGDTRTDDLGMFTSSAPIGCQSSMSYMDIVYEFTLTEASDIRYEVNASGFTPYVAVSETCGVAGGEYFCDGGNPQNRSLCAVPAGDYYLIARGNRAGDLDVTFEVSEPSSPPTNDTCAGAVDVSAGGTFPGTLLCTEADYTRPTCDFWNNHDVIYTFTLTEPQDVEVSLSPEDNLQPSLSIQTECGTPATEVLCLRGTSINHLNRSLEAGTYYIVINGEYEADFELEVTISAPTSACDTATVITESGTHSGDTSSRRDDFRTTCGNRGQGNDEPYILDVPYAFDLRAEVIDAAYDTVLHLRRLCDDAATEVACDDDSAPGGMLSLLDLTGLEAGEYVLVFDGYGSWSTGPYTLDVEITPVDTCLAPPVITTSTTLIGDSCAAPSLNMGSCGGTDAPETVTAIELAAESDVRAEVTSAAMDSVLYLRSTCGASGTEVGCSDGGAGLPVIDATALPAGTYYLMYDGGAVDACGAYNIDVTITPL